MTTTTTEQRHYLYSDAEKLLDVSKKHLRKKAKELGLNPARIGTRPGIPGICLLTRADIEALAAACKRVPNWHPCQHCNGTGRSNT